MGTWNRCCSRDRSIFVGFFLGSTDWNQSDGFFTQFDFKFRTRLQFHHCCVSLADQQVAVALNFGDIAELATTLANTAFTTKADTLGFQQSLIKCREVQAITPIFLGGDITTFFDKIRLGDITKVLDFGEQLDGFAFTRFGWVQSYGSRCVKPPIIFGDVTRPTAMTVRWSEYAQSLTEKPMKGMLTGPVTILQWSFVRDDQPRATTCRQIALALRDEVCDLEKAGIHVIQIDEPALREGLPLHQSEWQRYLDWAVESFQLSAAGVADSTQIHTHMCYSEFNDIIGAIAALDADVITIETSRSDMQLLDAFQDFAYPNEIGPGVYDIHTPNIPEVEWMVALMEKALEKIPAERLWVNPDCGLKTRGWAEVEPALANMVEAAEQLRQRYA